MLYWVIFTGISVETGWSDEVVKKRTAEIDAVAKKHGFADVFNFRLPTTRLDTLPLSDLIEKMTDVYKKLNPEIIYMPFAHDVHTDHQLVAKALQSTFKWFRYPHIKKVLMYETPSETEFNFIEDRTFCPNVFVDISSYLDNKVETMKIFNGEMGEFPVALDRDQDLVAVLLGHDCCEAFADLAVVDDAALGDVDGGDAGRHEGDHPTRSCCVHHYSFVIDSFGMQLSVRKFPAAAIRSGCNHLAKRKLLCMVDSQSHPCCEASTARSVRLREPRRKDCHWGSSRATRAVSS